MFVRPGEGYWVDSAATRRDMVATTGVVARFLAANTKSRCQLFTTMRLRSASKRDLHSSPAALSNVSPGRLRASTIPVFIVLAKGPISFHCRPGLPRIRAFRSWATSPVWRCVRIQAETSIAGCGRSIATLPIKSSEGSAHTHQTREREHRCPYDARGLSSKERTAR